MGKPLNPAAPYEDGSFIATVLKGLFQSEVLVSEARLAVESELDIRLACAAVGQLARALGFAPVSGASLVTASSELASNIVFHAVRGVFIIRHIQNSNHGPGVRVLALDGGPGIADLELAMTDGFSTGNGLGAGLPGAKRLMDDWLLASRVGEGTVVVAAKFVRPYRPLASAR